MVRISVISICFNNLADLQKTCESVDRQSYLPDEHYIINGSSTEEIKEWLVNTPQPAYRKWMNEPDKGISDAFNKGIQLASFELIHLLHAGDCYAENDVLATVTDFFENNPQTQWISGNMRMIRAGSEVIIGKAFEPAKLYRGMRSVSHPTWFVKKQVYERVGGFNIDYRIAMDYDLMCRIKDESYAYLNKLIAVFDDTGVSTANYMKSLAETKKAYTSYFGFSWKMELWQFRLKLLFFLLQTGPGKALFHLKKKMGLENM